jgi:hypothetical protein
VSDLADLDIATRKPEGNVQSEPVTSLVAASELVAQSRSLECDASVRSIPEKNILGIDRDPTSARV